LSDLVTHQSKQKDLIKKKDSDNGLIVDNDFADEFDDDEEEEEAPAKKPSPKKETAKSEAPAKKDEED
jgi:hypothetical protein